MSMGIKKSKMLKDGLCIWFDNGWYYAHGIRGFGDPSDAPGHLSTMWGWINHLREKIWWNEGLEHDFKNEVEEYYG